MLSLSPPLANRLSHREVNVIPTLHSTVRGLATLVAVGTLVLFPSLAHGQTITGRILDAVNERPVPGAVVEVTDDDGDRLGVAQANAQGEFVVELSRAGGPLVVRAGAMFYRLGSQADVIVRAGETLAVADIHLTPAPASLDGVMAETDRPRITRGAEWVRQRQMSGNGAFFAGSVIEMSHRGSLGLYLASETGLWPRPTYYGVGLRNPRGFYGCMVPMLNQWPLYRTGYRSLDEIPVQAIAAVEVYDNYRDVPWIMQGVSGNCGVVNVWTWNSW
jgi:hypothetical protein